MKDRDDIRNVAIIAHVDHGKTTIVDGLLKASGVFRQNQEVQERVMDSGDIERERGITILAKNTAVHYKDVKINIIDTPGHADFGGEVERVLKMAAGVVLVVDAFEGPMPQTKFVIKKAFELGLPAIVCINKIDRPNARIAEVEDEVLDLFIQLDESGEHLDAPFVYASAKLGYATDDYNTPGEDMRPLLDAILKYIPKEKADDEKPFKLLISTIDYNDYVGRIGIGKIAQGQIKSHDKALIVNREDRDKRRAIEITNIYEFEGLSRVKVDASRAGSIVAVTGVEGIEIGDTICTEQDDTALEFVRISEPTLQMNFSVNDSPFAGQDGTYVTSRQLRARLFREIETDVSLRVFETDSTETFRVLGRGELHLSVLIENMRREGYEFQVSKPQVIFHHEDGKTMEPIEQVTIDVDQEFCGVVIEKLGQRKAELVNMQPSSTGFTRLVFRVPARGLIGYRQQFLTDTKGNGVLNSEFYGYEEYKGEIPRRPMGSLISFETGEATSYGLYQAQDRGQLFITPQTKVYEGQVVGQNPKGLDIEVNVCKKKKQTNIRSAASDEALRLSPEKRMSLEEMMEFVEDDELIEVTPENLRVRKRILDTQLRYKSKKNNG